MFSKKKTLRPATTILIATCIFLASWNTVSAAPCPLETPMYGAKLDPTKTYYQTYFAVNDDDLTKVVSIRACFEDFFSVKREHFRGFSVSISSPTSGISSQTFGFMDLPGNECITVPITSEIMYLTVYSDLNDIEGLIFEGYDTTKWTLRGNGLDFSPKFRMGGRPIGFRVWSGPGGVANQNIQLAIVYNSCNCPASTFMLDAKPTDMTI